MLTHFPPPTEKIPTDDPALLAGNAEYSHPNLWPEQMPTLRDAFRDLGRWVCLCVRVCAGVGK